MEKCTVRNFFLWEVAKEAIDECLVHVYLFENKNILAQWIMKYNSREMNIFLINNLN